MAKDTKNHVKPTRSKSDKAKVCSVCNKTFTSNSVLNRHVKTIHTTVLLPAKVSRLICPVDKCDKTFNRDVVLRDHLSDQHNIEVVSEELNFDSEEDFETWRTDMQDRTLSEYVQDTATKRLTNGFRKKYLLCHRSYKSRPKRSQENNLRAVKLQGTNKIGISCPSRIEVMVYKEDGQEKVYVKFWKTHCGHACDLDHIKLSKQSRDEIAGKLKEGLTFDDVLKEISEGTGKEPLRLAAVGRQDLYNIMRDYNIKHQRRLLPHDIDTVQVWVNEMQSLGEQSPVVLFKQQGEKLMGFDRHDFILVIITPYQAMHVKKFAHDKVCIIDTHGPSVNDINMFTSVVVDEYGSGCPIASCFSNRNDAELLRVFSEKIKEKVGIVKATTFMSDDNSIFYDEWSKVMGAVKNRFLTSWHVERCWRKRLSKVQATETKLKIEKTLRALLKMIRCEREFKQVLQQLVTDLLSDSDTADFGEYFVKNYVDRPKSWAYCYRLDLRTNAFELFHKRLLNAYMNGKKVKRVETTIQKSLQITRDSLMKRFIILLNRIPDEHESEVRNRHAASEEIMPDMVTIIDVGKEWSVKSSVSNVEYIVTKSQMMCSDECVKCVLCTICVHNYECTCTDSVVNLNICIHIHACCRIFQTINNLPNKVLVCSEKPQIDTSIIANIRFITTNSTRVNERLQRKTNIIWDLLNKVTLNSAEANSLDRGLDLCINILNSRNRLVTVNKQTNKVMVAVNRRIMKKVRFGASLMQRTVVSKTDNITNSESYNNQKTITNVSNMDHNYSQ